MSRIKGWTKKPHNTLLGYKAIYQTEKRVSSSTGKYTAPAGEVYIVKNKGRRHADVGKYTLIVSTFPRGGDGHKVFDNLDEAKTAALNYMRSNPNG